MAHSVPSVTVCAQRSSNERRIRTQADAGTAPNSTSSFVQTACMPGDPSAANCHSHHSAIISHLLNNRALREAGFRHHRLREQRVFKIKQSCRKTVFVELHRPSICNDSLLAYC